MAVAALVRERRRARSTGVQLRPSVREAVQVSQPTIPQTTELVWTWVHFLRDQVQEAVAGVNNRLSAIALSAEMLGRTRLSDEQRQQVEQVTREVHGASSIAGVLADRVCMDTPEIPPPAWHVLADAAARPAHILVVEADEGNRTVLARLLRSLGHHVTTVVDGREAWETLAGAGFDCILCDPRLPGPAGRALYEQVEERLPPSARRFVFVTGELASPAVREFLRLTGQPVVGKPYELKTLLQAIATILTRVGVVEEQKR